MSSSALVSSETFGADQPCGIATTPGVSLVAAHGAGDDRPATRTSTSVPSPPSSAARVGATMTAVSVRFAQLRVHGPELAMGDELQLLAAWAQFRPLRSWAKRAAGQAATGRRAAAGAPSRRRHRCPRLRGGRQRRRRHRRGCAPASGRSSDSSVAVSHVSPRPSTSRPRRSPRAPNMRQIGQRSATGATIAGVNCVATAS